MDYIQQQYNRKILPEDETGRGEYYLDTLGVLPGHRGRGIGTRLLQFLLDEYVHRQHQTLGLLVEQTNPAAKRLYLQNGFALAGEKRFWEKICFISRQNLKTFCHEKTCESIVSRYTRHSPLTSPMA